MNLINGVKRRWNERQRHHELQKLIRKKIPIPFDYKEHKYYLNPEEGAIYHLSNSISKIGRMCDMVTRPPRIIFDVGANCGLFSAFMAAKFSDAKIFAFEPSSDLGVVLSLNCRSSNISVLPYAVGSENGEVTLFVNPNSQQTNSLNRDAVAVFGAEQDLKEVMVVCRTLDDVASEYGITKVDVLKVDVQGFEGNVFRGAEFVLKNVETLFVESSWLDMASVIDLVPFARRHGFEYAAVVNPVYMGADIMLSKFPIPQESEASFVFSLKDIASGGQWL